MKGMVAIDIQWYPGHMTKTKRMILADISLVDIVIELLDARIPYSSKNPDIDTLARNKKRIVLFNKADLADPVQTKQWNTRFEKQGFRVIETNAVTGSGLNDITLVSKELMREKLERLRQRGRIFAPTRAMIVGIPNVGKSTLINKFAGKAMAKTGDKPGVTKSKQWVKIKKDFELLDTPGILWPKFDDQDVGLKLACTGAIKDTVLDAQTIALHLIELLREIYPNCLQKRYQIDILDNETPLEILTHIGKARGFKKKGDEIDTLRAAVILTDEFRGGKLGPVTLDSALDRMQNP